MARRQGMESGAYDTALMQNPAAVTPTDNDTDAEDEDYKEGVGNASDAAAAKLFDDLQQADDGDAVEDADDDGDEDGEEVDYEDEDYEGTDVELPAINPTKGLEPFNATRFPPNLPYLKALDGCNTLECVHDAHFQPRADAAQFNFPHFFIIGWQKTATTSLFNYLSGHPQILAPQAKEPEVLTKDCNFNLRTCPAEDEVGICRSKHTPSQLYWTRVPSPTAPCTRPYRSFTCAAS
jgi:hypothetical protein